MVIDKNISTTVRIPLPRFELYHDDGDNGNTADGSGRWNSLLEFLRDLVNGRGWEHHDWTGKLIRCENDPPDKFDVAYLAHFLLNWDLTNTDDVASQAASDKLYGYGEYIPGDVYND